jgi:hypothetical protein
MAGLGALNPDVEVNNNGGGGGFPLLPDDDYELEITESDVKANSTGKGQNLDYKVQVVSGPHKGVTFFGGITSIQHESAQAQTIAQGQLKALCAAAGVDFTTLTDSEQLHFKPFYGRVGNETYFSKKHNKDVTKNIILKFLWDGMPEEGAAAAPPAAKAAATPPASSGAATTSSAPKRPWNK